MSKTAIGLMAKSPIQGTVKTRLASRIGDQEALRIYESLLLFSHNLLKTLDTTAFLRMAFISPAASVSDFRAQYPGMDSYSSQIGEDLGERMKSALEQLLSQKSVVQAILIGADCPGLTQELLGRAALLLREHDVVVGPTDDGGYYLIGVKHIHDKLFSGIAWSTETVLKETRSIVGSLGLTMAELPTLKDLDTEDDLEYYKDNGILTF